MNLLGGDERWLPRPNVEWLYHSFRCRAWDGKVDTIAGWYGFTAMRCLERSITACERAPASLEEPRGL
jgi:hypothetical protein